MKVRFCAAAAVLAMFAAVPAYATHKDDPMVLFACESADGAKAFVRAHADFSGAGKTVKDLVQEWRAKHKACRYVGDHVSDLTPEAQKAITAATPAEWTGSSVQGWGGGTWPHMSWHVEAVTVGGVEKHLIIVKKAEAPAPKQ